MDKDKFPIVSIRNNHGDTLFRFRVMKTVHGIVFGKKLGYEGHESNYWLFLEEFIELFNEDCFDARKRD